MKYGKLDLIYLLSTPPRYSLTHTYAHAQNSDTTNYTSASVFYLKYAFLAWLGKKILKPKEFRDLMYSFV